MTSQDEAKNAAKASASGPYRAGARKTDEPTAPEPETPSEDNEDSSK